MWCTNCGKENQDGAKFCRNCGTPLSAPEAPPVVEEPEPIPPEPVEPKKKKKKGKVIAFTVLCFTLAAALCVGVLWLLRYLSPEQKLLRALDEGNLEEAVRLYDEELEEDSDEITARILTSLETIRKDFASGSMDYEDAESQLSAYEDMAAGGTSSDLRETRSLVDGVKASRDAFDQAGSLEASKDYAGAMDQYAQVIPEDTLRYEEALQKLNACVEEYRNLILADAATYADKELYEDAINKILEGLEVLPQDEILTKQMETYAQNNTDLQRKLLLEKAQAYVDQQDYPNAIRTLEGHGEDPELDAMYKVYCDEYVKWTLSQAEEAFKNQGYQAALEKINLCLQTLPENGELLEEKAHYETYAPVWLATLESMTFTGDKTYSNKYTMDMYENEYQSSFAVDQGTITFLNNGKYAHFSGTVVCPKGFEYDSVRTSAQVFIYVDNELVWQSEQVLIDSQPQSFNLDITGCQTVSIEWTCQGSNIWDNWGDRATIFDAAFWQH